MKKVKEVLKKTSKIGALTVGIMLLSTMGAVSANKIAPFIRDTSTVVEATPESLYIMGYQPMDYAQAMSYILSRIESSPFPIEEVRLEGVTLEEVLVNIDAACYIEGLNPNVVLVQQIIETGTYFFKRLEQEVDGVRPITYSSVPPSYYNFAGIGAYDYNPKPFVFENNLAGQISNVHLLKIYASKEDMVLPLRHPQFLNNTREKAVNVSQLSLTWANNAEYGELITSIYNTMMNHETDIALLKKYAGRVYPKQEWDTTKMPKTYEVK